MFTSMMVRVEWRKPSGMAWRSFFPALSSSLMRSKERTLPSTAAPRVRTRPAMPGRVRVAPRPERRPRMRAEV